MKKYTENYKKVNDSLNLSLNNNNYINNTNSIYHNEFSQDSQMLMTNINN